MSIWRYAATKLIKTPLPKKNNCASALKYFVFGGLIDLNNLLSERIVATACEVYPSEPRPWLRWTRLLWTFFSVLWLWYGCSSILFVIIKVGFLTHIRHFTTTFEQVFETTTRFIDHIADERGCTRTNISHAFSLLMCTTPSMMILR